MYRFRDLNTSEDDNYTSSVAMTWNGDLLEDQVPGYKTLNVEGRGLVDSYLAFHPLVPGRDGDIVSSETVKSRYLVIQFQIDAEDRYMLREAYNKLNSVLRNHDRTTTAFSFADEPEYTFYGRFSDAVEPDPATNNPVGYLRLLCEDPYKYGPVFELKGTSVHDFNYPLKVESIEFTMPSATNKLTILNQTTGRRIILNGDYTTGQVIKIADGNITKNGQTIKNNLDYIESDWHGFKVRAGDIISVSPTATLKIMARRRLL